jgi:hypothetical protein
MKDEGGRMNANALIHPSYFILPKVRMVGVEPTLSGFRRRRITRLSHILKQQ